MNKIGNLLFRCQVFCLALWCLHQCGLSYISYPGLQGTGGRGQLAFKYVSNSRRTGCCFLTHHNVNDLCNYVYNTILISPTTKPNTVPSHCITMVKYEFTEIMKNTTTIHFNGHNGDKNIFSSSVECSQNALKFS